MVFFFFFSSRRRHTRFDCDWSSDVCSSDLAEQRRLHPLTLAGNLALQQGDQNSHRAENAGAEIGDRNADAHRALTRKTRDRHQPAHALGDLVEPGTLAIGSVLTEARNRTI